MSWTLPGSTGADQTGNPGGSATICTLPPWVLCLPEYHRWGRARCGGRPPVDLDQCAIHGHMRPTQLSALLKHVVQGRSLFGNHIDRFVQVAAVGGDRQPRVTSQLAQRSVVPEPAQHQLRLHAHRSGPTPGTGPDPTTVRGQRPRHEHQGFGRHVTDGRVGKHVGFCWTCFVVKPILWEGPHVLPDRHADLAGHTSHAGPN